MFIHVTCGSSMFSGDMTRVMVIHELEHVDVNGDIIVSGDMSQDWTLKG